MKNKIKRKKKKKVRNNKKETIPKELSIRVEERKERRVAVLYESQERASVFTKSWMFVKHSSKCQALFS